MTKTRQSQELKATTKLHGKIKKKKSPLASLLGRCMWLLFSKIFFFPSSEGDERRSWIELDLDSEIRLVQLPPTGSQSKTWPCQDALTSVEEEEL